MMWVAVIACAAVASLLFFAMVRRPLSVLILFCTLDWLMVRPKICIFAKKSQNIYICKNIYDVSLNVCQNLHIWNKLLKCLYLLKFSNISISYFLKARVLVVQTPQTVLNFPQKDFWESEKYQNYTVCRAINGHFPYLCSVTAINCQ